jgi:hypothetical protein
VYVQPEAVPEPVREERGAVPGRKDRVLRVPRTCSLPSARVPCCDSQGRGEHTGASRVRSLEDTEALQPAHEHAVRAQLPRVPVRAGPHRTQRLALYTRTSAWIARASGVKRPPFPKGIVRVTRRH